MYNFLIGVLLGLLPVLVYGMLRNNWVSNCQTQWINKVFEFRKGLIQSNNMKLYDVHSTEDMYNAIDSYDTMILKFWVWDKEKFIRNKMIYDMVLEGRI